MSICIVPDNQPIYQALLDKAASYPADKTYEIAAYKGAAQRLSTLNKNLYIDPVTDFGMYTTVFIEDFIKANPNPNPKPVASVWEQLKEMVVPDLYTSENPQSSLAGAASLPRRSARIAAKASSAKPPASKPVTKPIVTPPGVQYFREEKKASTAVPIIRTYGADDDGYTTTGYALYRANGKFEIINVGHCSCFDTVEVLEGYDEDEFENTLAHIVCLATSKSEPRIPDVVTEDPHLIALYASILEHKDVLETWKPEELDEHLDMIEVHDPELHHLL